VSLDPQIPLPPLTVVPQPPPSAPIRQPEYRWYHKLSAFIFILFCMELGAFLLVFPWTDWWDQNLFSSFVPEWHRLWDNAYLRGAVSGLGVVNFYISFLEIIRLRRFARRNNDED
jgi:hypothetical protein